MDAQPVAPVNALQLAGSISGNDMSLMGLFGHADIVGKLVIAGLLMISLITWASHFRQNDEIEETESQSRVF